MLKWESPKIEGADIGWKQHAEEITALIDEWSSKCPDPELMSAAIEQLMAQIT
jgi:hypothetical protein